MTRWWATHRASDQPGVSGFPPRPLVANQPRGHEIHLFNLFLSQTHLTKQLCIIHASKRLRPVAIDSVLTVPNRALGACQRVVHIVQSRAKGGELWRLILRKWMRP